MINERWKPIKGFEDKYHVSDLGRVKSLERFVTDASGLHLKPERILKPQKDSDGYLIVLLSVSRKVRHTRTIHKLVVKSFIRDYEKKDGLQIRHLDGDKNNNALHNLEIGNAALNHLDKYRHGSTKLSIEQTLEILNSTEKQKSLAEKYGVRQSCISRIKSGVRGKIARLVIRSSNEQLAFI